MPRKRSIKKTQNHDHFFKVVVVFLGAKVAVLRRSFKSTRVPCLRCQPISKILFGNYFLKIKKHLTGIFFCKRKR
jgi:hypothetical protein